ncbi:MAG: MarR family transcriptional regulator [Caulobacter sp.]|jgi:DNA-binding MarR family transcriptional regulator|nr:MarR family transcriptional regulator [Caulobacter sp.]
MDHPLLMMNLMSGLYWFDEALQAHIKAAGWESLTRTQSMVMANIAAGEHRATRLARNLGVTRQAISQMLSDMEKRGLVEVKVDPDDKRARIVDFSPETEALRGLGTKVLRDLEKTLGERIGKARFDALHDALHADWGAAPTPE